MQVPTPGRSGRLLPGSALLLGAVLLLSLLLGAARPAYADEIDDPSADVTTNLTAQGYEVLEVRGPDTVPNIDDAAVLMTIASDQLDEVVTAQLQAGWTALGTYYPDVSVIRTALMYEQRYILLYSITTENWNAWLNGDLPPEDFWDNVGFAVFDVTTNKYVSNTRDFVDKNFAGGELPGPNLPDNPANLPGDPSSMLLDVSSLLVPAGTSGSTALARITDEQGRRVPGQTITFTVGTSDVGDFDATNAPTDQEGVARASYSPADDLDVPDDGVPVNISVSGPGKLSAKQRLLVANINTTDPDSSSQAVAAALTAAGYKVLNVGVYQETMPTGEVIFWGGPYLESKSSQVDAAFFQQAKAAIGTTLAAYPQLTYLSVYIRVKVEGKAYWVAFSPTRASWNAWVSGTMTEQQFWSEVPIDTYDKNWNSADSKNFVDKNFGTGEPAEVTSSDTRVTYTASIVQEEWGPQQYFGEFTVPVGASMDTFSAELHDGALSWRIYDLHDLHQPIFDSAEQDAAELTLGQGVYFLSVEADGPPASVTMKATLHVRY